MTTKIFYTMTLGAKIVEKETLDEIEAFKTDNPEWANVPAFPVPKEIPEIKDPVPASVTLWQLRKFLKRTKLTQFHNEATVQAIGTAIGLTAQQATSYSLFQWVKHIISIMPEDTPEQADAKDTAEEAIEYANNIERDSPVIAAIGQKLQLSTEDKDLIFQEAKTM